MTYIFFDFPHVPDETEVRYFLRPGSFFDEVPSPSPSFDQVVGFSELRVFDQVSLPQSAIAGCRCHFPSVIALPLTTNQVKKNVPLQWSRAKVELGAHLLEAGGEAAVVHLLGALPDGVLGIDASAVHVALLDGLLDLELLRLLLLLALPRLPLQRLGRELQLHDLVQQLFRVPHRWRSKGEGRGRSIGGPKRAYRFEFSI
ncbi:hypothetical protein CRG98_001885 [Punica granatum]|uniref:Uncharacterized protein n=1 Tax=Punica granatum TaxID=22663 RepID=A0A2I0LAR6_PUNGR|nr:hypothetical protein CRG98_001885 [Punica granatum]